MALMAKQPEGISPIEGGTYQAVCYSVVDLGTQHSERFDQDLHQACLTWEFPEVRIDVDRNGKTENLPRVISRTYTLSLSEKANLYKDLVSWRGVPFTPDELEGFDLFAIGGANCLLTITNEVKDGKTRAKIAGIAKLMKGMTKLPPENPLVRYCIMEDALNIPESVPDWLKKQIAQSMEWRAIKKAQMSTDLAAAQAAYGVSDMDEGQGSALTGEEIPF